MVDKQRYNQYYCDRDNYLRSWWNDTRVPEPIMDDVRCTKDDDISTCYKRIMGHNCKQDDKVWLRCYNETGLMWELVTPLKHIKLSKFHHTESLFYLQLLSGQSSFFRPSSQIKTKDL